MKIAFNIRRYYKNKEIMLANYRSLTFWQLPLIISNNSELSKPNGQCSYEVTN